MSAAARAASTAAPRRRWVVGLVVAGVAVFALPLAFGLTRDPGAGPSSPLIGRAAPDLVLPRLDGRGTVSLQHLRGHVVVLNFWASWCRECRTEHGALAATWDRFRDLGVVLVGVPFQDAPSSARSYVAELGVDWPQAEDPGARAALDFGVTGVPETYLIGPDGTVLRRWIGPVRYGSLAVWVARALKGAA